MHIVKTWIDPTIHLNHIEYQQYFKGLKVERAIYLEHSNNDSNSVVTTNGMVCEGMSGSEVPQITEVAALEAALTHVNATEYYWENDSIEYFHKLDSILGDTTFYPIGELVWALTGDSICPSNYTLAWKFEIFASDPIYHSNVYINAGTEEFLKEENLISHATGTFHHMFYNMDFNIDTKEYLNKYRLWTSQGGFRVKTKDDNYVLGWSLGKLTRNDDNSWGTNHWGATQCHWAATESWRLWNDTYFRNGADDHGKELRVFADDSPPNGTFSSHSGGYDDIHVGRVDNNVQGSIKVIGHEFAHRVVFYTAELGSSGERGVLNESYSDIFALMADRKFWGTMRNWQMLEEFSGTVDITRDFEDPSNHNDEGCSNAPHPSSFQDSDWHTVLDDCGIHINSTVQSHCFFLLANGGTGFGGTNVIGIGIDKAARIAEFALSNKIKATKNHLDNRDQWVAAARELFGKCSIEAIQTCRAWKAVNVGQFCFCIEESPTPCWPVSFEEVGPESPSLGIKEAKNYLNGIAIYPNPTSNNFTINLSELTYLERQSIKSIELIDINGRLIRTILLANKLKIDTSIDNVPDGIYTVKIQSTNFVKTARLIKQ